MAIEVPTISRKLYLSNPNVIFSRLPFADDDREYNVNEIILFLPDLLDFETHPDLIFEDDFE